MARAPRRRPVPDPRDRRSARGGVRVGPGGRRHAVAARPRTPEPTLLLTAFTVGPFQENCYLVGDEAAGECVLVDPGDEGDRLIAAVRRSGLALTAIWLTHAHIDHIGAIAAVKRAWDVPVFLHPLDAPLYAAGTRQAAHYGLPFEQPAPPERTLADGDRVSVGSLAFDVMHAPGHAPGHVVFHGQGVALVGDCLFQGSIGRTDLPLSDPAALERSLEAICALPAETVVHPGHGPATTVGRELDANPFLNGVARIPRAR